MIFADDKRVCIDGSVFEILTNIALVCDNVCEQSVEKLGIPKEEMTNKIMETVAFALCTEEEQKMLIEAKIKKLMEGEEK